MMISFLNSTDQTALKAINSEVLDNRNHYQHAANNARLPEDQLTWSAFYKARSLAMVFKNRKIPRAQLKAMCQTFNIPYLELVCDMPVGWNSSDMMPCAFLKMEKAIRAVLAHQDWDASVRT